MQIGIGNNFTAAMALANGGLISSQVSGFSHAHDECRDELRELGQSGGAQRRHPHHHHGWLDEHRHDCRRPPPLEKLGPLNATAGIGTFTNSGGTVNLTGTLNNTASTLTLNATTGSWNLAGGTISGGTLAFADGQNPLITANNANLLSGRDGERARIPWMSVAGARTKVAGGTTFKTAHLAVIRAEPRLFAPGQTLNGTILFEGAGTSTRFVEMNGTAGTFTIGATGVIRTDGVGGGAQIGIGQPILWRR